METQMFDVLVIGAGAAGLMAALEIAGTGRTVAVLEAKDRIGGRMFTVESEGFTIEYGAEFVHGNLPLTRELLKKAGAGTNVVEGSFWQSNDGRLQRQEDFIEDYDDLEKKCKALEHDKPFSKFLSEDLRAVQYEELRYSLKNYAEGYDAADTNKASTFALCEDLQQSGGEQSRIRGGYRMLASYLQQECQQRGVRFFLSQPVTQLHWKQGEVVAVTDRGSFSGKKAVISVSIGVLKKKGITFFPALPAVAKAVEQLGFGHVCKLVLQFKTAFWKNKAFTQKHDLSDLAFLFSREAFPTWWTHSNKPAPFLTAWLGGPRAEASQFQSKAELTAKALSSLAAIFALDTAVLQEQLVQSWYYNWSEDPFFGGAYSYAVVNGTEAINVLQQPVSDSLFFAGEGLHSGPEIGTVEGALASGKEAAERLLSTFSV